MEKITHISCYLPTDGTRPFVFMHRDGVANWHKTITDASLRRLVFALWGENGKTIPWSNGWGWIRDEL